MLGEEVVGRYEPLSATSYSDAKRPSSVEIPLYHVQQEGSWDCGIACVAMVLSDDHRSELLSKLNAVGEEEGFKNSVWTIDLAYLLKKYDVPHVFYTITLGVDSGYAEEEFYRKVLDVDQERVQKRFEDAADYSIKVIQRSLSLDEILDHISTQQPAIVLVDSNLLHCDSCGLSLFKGGSLSMWPCCSAKGSYNGHFIVICGYNHNTQKILYRNPTHKNRICLTSYNEFETARHAYGTDDDIILLGSS